jgi:hypothetical protein
MFAAGLVAAIPALHAQTADQMQSAQDGRRAGETDEQHGRRLLDQMLGALGGNAWINRQTQYVEGQTANFFQGQPTGAVIRFVQWKRYATAAAPEVTRIEFVSYRGMIEPGTVRQVAHLWTGTEGYEYTYKGRTELPEKQVADYFRRRDHSVETVMRTWLHAPGTVVLYLGVGERDRRAIDKVSILRADNDNVTFEIEQNSHLPLERSFEYRNQQFKDFDLDEEVFGDWRMFDGIATPMNSTDYHNGDMVSQTFFKKVEYNKPTDAALFDPNHLLKK